jgi:two-component system, sensor histidine kinase
MNAISIRAHCLIEQCIDFYMHPVCLILDKKFRTKAWSGDFSYYGFDGIAEGKDCRDSMLFMVGLSSHESVNMQFIETPNARAVHLHLIVNLDEIIVVLLDATEPRINHGVVQQKSNELALMHIQQNKLIENLKRLEKEIEEKRRQAEHANLLKGRFIATMSHEFRTPLTSILGYTWRLKQRDDFDPTTLKHLNSVERGAQHLLSLVENILDQAQIDMDSLTINPVATPVRVVLDKLASIFQPLAEDKHLGLNIELTPDLPEHLLLDEVRFRQILVNLISNAIKFTERGSINVAVGWADGALIVSVEDTGKGIAEADQERIFTAFEQVGNHPGTGLGLSIVKHLVTVMGGKLTLVSSLGQGSRFDVSLPAQAIHIASDTPQNSLAANDLQEKPILKSVLLVEDDPDIMALLQSALDDAGYPTLTASNGRAALDAALSNWPDLVLLDLNLPDMMGFEVIKTLRAHNFQNPVFAQSAWTAPEHKAKAIAAGCNEFIIKPLNINELKDLISVYFSNDTDYGMPVERYLELLKLYRASLPEKHKKLLELMGNNSQHNWGPETLKDLHDFAHRLAGSAGLYRMRLISDTAKHLDQLMLDYERLTGQGDPAELQTKIMAGITSLARHILEAFNKEAIVQ